MNVLFVTHKDYQCGVYQYGYNTVNTLVRKAKKYKFIHTPCVNQQELYDYIEQYRPIAIIYNYHPSVLGWASAVSPKLNIKQLAIHHEPTVPLPPNMTAVISQDPTIQETSTLFSSGRLIFDYDNMYPDPEVVTIGSFGFGLPGKGFQRLTELILEEFNVAKIRLHIAYATYGDASGVMARAEAEKCRKMIYKKGISLEITHAFKSIDQLIDWLAQNTLNAFLYDGFPGRGISSPPDYALSARKPMALTKSYMFKHLLDAEPSIFIEDLSLKEIIANGLEPLQQFYDKWSEEKLSQTYERIITTIL